MLFALLFSKNSFFSYIQTVRGKVIWDHWLGCFFYGFTIEIVCSDIFSNPLSR